MVLMCKGMDDEGGSELPSSTPNCFTIGRVMYLGIFSSFYIGFTVGKRYQHCEKPL